ncbi:MAG TPA: hypothetical protein VFS75_01720 [Candidatus Paceibacterota bacterium]|nr:hypothetical protein [Candidatus Paceibacterota bacterium]
MKPHTRGNALIVVVVVIAIALIAGIYIYGVRTPSPSVDSGTESPAGTSTAVTPVVPTGWKTADATSSNATFSYPESFGTTYVEAYDWPPVLTIENQSYSCTEAGSPDASGGRTEKRIIDGKEYCVTTEMGGAAGSVYSQYAYATDLAGKEAILTFTVRSPQCGNYEEPQKSECANEEATFDLDSLIGDIMQTIGFKPAA